MKKTYQTPSIAVQTIKLESVITVSQGDIRRVEVSDTQTITSGSDFGVKGNYVQWDDWEK